MEHGCDVSSEQWCNHWPKKPDLPWYATPTQLNRSFLIWYDTCTDHPVWGQCGDRPGCSIFSKHRRPTENGSNVSRKWNRSIVSALHDKMTWRRSSSSLAANVLVMLNDGLWRGWNTARRSHASSRAYGLSIIWLKQRQARRRTVKERDRDRNKDTERVKALPHEAPSSDSRQRETEEERKVSDST